MSVVRSLLIGVALSSLVSCSAAKVYIGVAQARNDFARGEFQDANRRLIALTGSEAFAPWISYDLGTVYYALGEPASASEIWRTSDPTASAELAFRIQFNLGVLEYERGSYRSAYERFRGALEIDPGRIEAKVNLELAIERIENEEGNAPAESPDASPGSEVGRLLQYIERLEGGVWASPEWIESEGGEVRDW